MSDEYMVSRCHCGACKLKLSNVTKKDVCFDCHCQSCRRMSCSTFVSYLSLTNDQVQVVNNDQEGEDAPLGQFRETCGYHGTQEVDRVFCGKCYSSLATRSTNASMDDGGASSEQRWFINMGTLEDDTIPADCSEMWKATRPSVCSDEPAPWYPAEARYDVDGGALDKSSAPTVLTGGCSCGKFRFKMTPSPGCSVLQCYCQMCRRFSGAPVLSWTYGALDEFEWICRDDGEEKKEEPVLFRSSPFAQRHMCPTCACNLTVVYDEEENVIWPAVGCFDDECFLQGKEEPTSTDDADTTTTKLNNNKGRLDAHLKDVSYVYCQTVPVWYRPPSDGLPMWDALPGGQDITKPSG
uniref:CENP-V/GFA domain-containing protein n=1 Tax=Grammatophora oceanica TaxID=210454 RepID=A0A7S1UUD3_9STRA|eukprot:CAMPEP_0194047942 /NCGR_PEP_ID=MMETSP0009_2-20130614/26302_1 /TAXON_ID=210454 /ORGANISM="Grammatophora oceanica, Strain CCMP 410" /LENGTH=351 /DNA_ID=CAMNT_0038693707 /DNA_START=80 /DNA_END=1135 /DNA_ORIENTATION=+